MARRPRFIPANVPHHVITRGNARQEVFADDVDRAFYLATLAAVARSERVAIHAYVLMSNHVHLLATAQSADGISRVMQMLGRVYVRRYNDRHGRTGTLWDGRFRSNAIDTERYFMECMRYIELNPVRAGLVALPEQYPWSSYRHHAGTALDKTVSDHALYWQLGNTPFEREAAYRALAAEALPTELTQRITATLQTGRPLGSAQFLTQLEIVAGYPLGAGKRGRRPLALPEA
jgi:putative transposase